MPAIELLDVAELEAMPAMKGHRAANLFRVLGHARTMFPGYLQMGEALLDELELEIGLREIAILRVAALNGAVYVEHHHRNLANRIGLPSEAVAAACCEIPSATLPEVERLVLDYVDAAVRHVEASPDLRDAVLAALGPRRFVELTLVIGFYLMVALVVRNGGVEIEAPDTPPAR